MNSNIITGNVVWSKKGRDKDNCYIVVKVVNNDYVYVADGKYHKMDKPKLKNKKHLLYKGDSLTGLAEKLITGKQIFDGELFKALRAYSKNSEKE